MPLWLPHVLFWTCSGLMELPDSPAPCTFFFSKGRNPIIVCIVSNLCWGEAHPENTLVSLTPAVPSHPQSCPQPPLYAASKTKYAVFREGSPLPMILNSRHLCAAFRYCISTRAFLLVCNLMPEQRTTGQVCLRLWVVSSRGVGRSTLAWWAPSLLLLSSFKGYKYKVEGGKPGAQDAGCAYCVSTH